VNGKQRTGEDDYPFPISDHVLQNGPGIQFHRHGLSFSGRLTERLGATFLECPVERLQGHPIWIRQNSVTTSSSCSEPSIQRLISVSQSFSRPPSSSR
jgi:hypothetical protein